jgi:plasmid stabilization system protein ParE
VPAVLLSAHAEEDLGRIVEFLLASEPATAAATGELVIDALEILARHPLIGRPAEGGLHELVISRGKTGYCALYEFDVAAGLVVVHAIRHRREAGWRE